MCVCVCVCNFNISAFVGYKELLHSHNKTNKCTNVKIIVFTHNLHNSDMFQSILFIFRELLIII